jgi:colanic acid/amylovoran biosynthesis protein
MIGTRLHSVIFSLVGGAPAIAISYNHKVDGIMGMLGLEKYVLDISMMEISVANAMIRNVLAEEERVLKLANTRIQDFRLILRKTLKELVTS